MSPRFFDRPRVWFANLRYFIPALAVFAAAAFWSHPAAAVLLLAADALLMVAISRAVGLGARTGFGQALIGAALPQAALFVVYAAVLLLLTAYPLQWLLREQSLGATLAVSTEAFVALFSLWRIWPCFGLLSVRHAGERAPRNASATAALQRCTALAREISGQNELFFSHGLPVAFCVLLLAAAALAIGAGFPHEPASRLLAVALYAGVLAPLATAVIVLRSVDGLKIELRRRRAERTVESAPAMADQPEPVAPAPTSSGNEEVAPDARLLRCARAGQTELALGALAHGADPNTVPPAEDRDQRSVLVLATLGGDLRLLRALIGRGADLNRAHAGLTPLIAATRDSHRGRPDAVMTLLTNGADPRCVDGAGNTPLHYAALSQTPIVSALLCDSAAPLEAVNRDGLTPLGMACAAGNWTLARFLLERGARTEPERAQPALLAASAVADDDPAGVALLIKRKAHVDARDALGRTPLMVAALHANAAVADALLEAGAQPGLADTRGTTALMEAARSGAQDIVDQLIARGAALDALDAMGRTALIIACQSRQAGEGIVRSLRDAGAALAPATAEGKSCVDFAAAGGRWNLVAMLDPNYPLPANVAEAAVAAAPDPESPQHLLDALRFGHWNIVETFATRVRGWPYAETERLFQELLTHEPDISRRWLLDHGLQRFAAAAEGDALAGTLLGRLPQSAAALADWHRAGATAAGSGRLATLVRALTAAPPEQHALLERLVLGFLEAGADPFAPDGDGRTALSHASAAGSLAIVRALLERGVDPNARDRHGRTPLFYAIALPAGLAQSIVALLVGAGADPEVAAINGETPLGLALARPEAEVRRWLNWPRWRLPKRRLRPEDLPAAAAVGDLDAVAKLSDLGFAIGAVDAQGADALLRAAGSGHLELVRRLLACGADPAHAAPSGATALSAAVTARRDAVVAALLEHGVAVDHRLPTGGTPLMIAAALGFPEIAARLLAHGADVNAQDERGTRALHAAAQFAFRSNDAEGARRLLEMLLRHGAEVDATNASGQTALLLLLGGRADPGIQADQRQVLDQLPLFLLARADVNRADQRGVGPLHACAMHGLLLPARALLAANADPARRDVLDRTPRQVAHLLGYIDVAAELGAREPVPVAGSGVT